MASVIVSHDDISVTSSRDRIACSRSDILSMVRMSSTLYNIAGACSALTRSPRDVCCLSVSTTTASSSSFPGRCSIATGSFKIALRRQRLSHSLRHIVSSLRHHLAAVTGSCLSTIRIDSTEPALLSVRLARSTPERDSGAAFGQHFKELLRNAESIQTFWWYL
jgi:hypothetical protein